jgi:hypothetical protein
MNRVNGFIVHILAWCVWTAIGLALANVLLEIKIFLFSYLSGYPNWLIPFSALLCAIAGILLGWQITYKLLFKKINPAKILIPFYVIVSLITIALMLAAGPLNNPFRAARLSLDPLTYVAMFLATGLIIMLTIRNWAKRLKAVRGF